MSGPLRVGVSGATGRMGAALAALAAEQRGVELVGGIARRGRPEADARAIGYPRIVGVDAARPIVEGADVLIDFSALDQLARVLDEHGAALAGRGLLVGTTGLEPWIEDRLDDLAERAPVLVAANCSVGVNVLLALLESAAAALPAERYDVEIAEVHHRHKADAPSGTAIALGDAVARGRGDVLAEVRRDGRAGRGGERPRGEIAFHALRGGEVPGDHRVFFLGGREVVELGHRALDRALFAEGALLAARWLAGRDPGRYRMRDVLGLS